MPFKKGRSGNPGGRPKMAEEIRELARAACPKAIQTLIAQLDHPDARIAATVDLDKPRSKRHHAAKIPSSSRT